MFKLLLIIPPCFVSPELDFEIGFPVHLAFLGESARAAGWSPEYLARTLEEKEGLDSFAILRSKLDDPAVRVVGVSNHTVRTFITTRLVAECVKAARPEVTVVVGGVNATFMWRELLHECAAVDFVMRGYAQPALRRLLTCGPQLRCASIAGRDTRASYDVVPAALTADDFRAPQLAGLPVERYLSWTTTYPLLTHSGCDFSCNFCTSVMPGPYQNRELHRPVLDVMSEMLAALDAGFERFFISDNVFTSRRDRCLSLCRAMKEESIGERATWVCMTRVEFVDAELLEAMRNAGCVNVAFGVETAGEEAWRTLQKGRYAESTIRNTFHAVRSAGMGTTAYLMVGAPSQTVAEIDRTIALLRDLDPDYRVVSFFQPFPGTPYGSNPEAYGLSEIAPLSDWNFHEQPICRTAALSKDELLKAAMRIYLDRAEKPLDLYSDSIAVRSEGTVLPIPETLRDIISLCDGTISVQDILQTCMERHGSRGRLMLLYWLSAAIANGEIDIVSNSLTEDDQNEERISAFQ